MRVAIAAEVPGDGSAGGVQQALGALLCSLRAAGAADVELVVLSGQRSAEWLVQCAGSAAIAPRPRSLRQERSSSGSVLSTLRWAAGHVAASLQTNVRRLGGEQTVTTEDAWVRSLGCEVIHFPYQRFYKTSLPFVFNPWDLQHLHLPDNFSAEVRRERQERYEAGCRLSRAVVVATEWARADLVSRLGVPLSHIFVIPLPPLNGGLSLAPGHAADRVHRSFGLRTPYLFYPAHTYPHKNHSRLIEALALLRSRGMREIRCVFSGAAGSMQQQLEGMVRALRLERHVLFAGFVAPDDLWALYAASSAVVIPSLFEGYCLPILEAFALGVPVACSTATCLPEVAGDAAIYFHAMEVSDIASTIGRLWSDADLRRELGARGRRRVLQLDPSRIGLAHMAVYYRAAGRYARPEQLEALQSFGNECQFSG